MAAVTVAEFQIFNIRTMSLQARNLCGSCSTLILSLNKGCWAVRQGPHSSPALNYQLSHPAASGDDSQASTCLSFHNLHFSAWHYLQEESHFALCRFGVGFYIHLARVVQELCFQVEFQKMFFNKSFFFGSGIAAEAVELAEDLR